MPRLLLPARLLPSPVASSSLTAAIHFARPSCSYSTAAAAPSSSALPPSLRRHLSLESSSSASSTSPLLSSAALKPPVKPRRAAPRPKKAALTLTPSAVEQLASLSQTAPAGSPTLLKIGLRTKGCAGMAYHLEYVDRPGRFDEVVEQDGVKVIIDSRALMGVLGSEMDWIEDRLSAKFVFHNPNIVDACGCGESFNIAA